MNRLNALCVLGKNNFKYRGFDLFRDKLLNPSVPKIKSIEKCYYSNDINFADEWIKTLNEQQQQQIIFIRNEVNLVIHFIKFARKLNKIFVFFNIFSIVDTIFASRPTSSETGMDTTR